MKDGPCERRLVKPFCLTAKVTTKAQLAGCTLAPSFAVLLICSCGQDAGNLTPAREAVIKALDGRCPIEGRLAGFPRPSPARPPALPRDRLRRILREAAGRPTETTLAARSLADAGLLASLAGDLDAGVKTLERSVQKAPADSQLLNDLAAMYITRARVQDRPQDLVRALSAAEKAVASEKAPQGACYNKALALEKLFLLTEALSAWQSCLALERIPAWRAEILSRVWHAESSERRPAWSTQEERLRDAALRGDSKAVARIVGLSAQPARELAEERELGDWAAAKRSQDQKMAARHLAVARAVGMALANRGDRMAADSAGRAESLQSTADAKGLQALVEAHSTYAHGLEAWRQGLYITAAGNFRNAEILFERAASPFALWARLQQARCDFQRTDYEAVSRSLGSLVRSADVSRYPIVVAKALSIQGLASMIRGNPSSALDQLAQSLALFTRLGELSNRGIVANHLSQAYESVGDSPASWRYRLQALEAAQQQGDVKLRFLACEEGAVACLRISEPRIALYFQNEVVRTARAWGDASGLAGALRGRATIHLRLGEQAATKTDLEEAQHLLSRIPDKIARRSLDGDLRLISGEAELSSSPRAAVTDFGESLQIYRQTDYRYFLPQVYVNRARAFRALGYDDRAEEDFGAALREWEEGRRDVVDDPRRSAYFDRARSLFNEMISFQIGRRHRADVAFDYVERAKSRVLLDWLSDLRIPESASRQPLGTGGSPMTLQEIRQDLSAGVVLIQYWVLEDRLLIWMVRREEMRSVSVPIDSKKLAESVRKFVEIAKRYDGSRVKGAAKELSSYLWAPVQEWVPEQAHVVFLPDLALHEIPFAALVARRGQYLAELYSTSVAPSASVFVKASAERARRIRGAAKAILIVGNPFFDRSRFPNLAALPSSERELSALRRAFPGAGTQIGSAAKKASFLRAAGGYRIVHFSGHSVVNFDAPLRSFLVFAPDEHQNSSGALFAYEVMNRRFVSTCLVVLSACSTARGYIFGMEGATGLARAFLATGVPAVLASLWNVDDAAASRFFNQFYTGLVSQGSIEEAVRAAQENMISEGTPVATWAAFELLGSAGTKGKEFL